LEFFKVAVVASKKKKASNTSNNATAAALDKIAAASLSGFTSSI
jgi:hypothetical protein